jgi:hypothetical protein
VAVAANLFGSSSSLKRKQKVEYSFQVDKEKKKYMKTAAKYSRVQEVEKLYSFLQHEGLPDHILVRRSTRRKELHHMLPLLIKTKVFGKCRRRRRSRAGLFQRIFGFISFLAVLSLRGFGGSRNGHILKGSSLWKRRARNKKLVILKGKQVEGYKTNNDKVKEGE